MSEINFKRIIEEAYSEGVTELKWELSENGSFKTIRYPNAIIFIGMVGFIGAVYTDNLNYSTRKFTPYLTQKLGLTSGVQEVKVSYIENNIIKKSFSFSGEIVCKNFYLQSLFKPVKDIYLEKLRSSIK